MVNFLRWSTNCLIGLIEGYSTTKVRSTSSQSVLFNYEIFDGNVQGPGSSYHDVDTFEESHLRPEYPRT